MKRRYLAVTFLHGKPLAAYLDLRQGGRRTVTVTRDGGHGLKGDFDAAGNLVGVEITAPSIATAASVNAVLVKFGARPIDAQEEAELETALRTPDAKVQRAWGEEIDRRAARVLAGEVIGLRREELRSLFAMSPADARARLAALLDTRK